MHICVCRKKNIGLFYRFYPACECNEDGSTSIACNDDGKCYCKDNIMGDKCDEPGHEYYNFPDVEGRMSIPMNVEFWTN